MNKLGMTIFITGAVLAGTAPAVALDEPEVRGISEDTRLDQKSAFTVS